MAERNWSDLMPRVLSGVVMVVLGIALILLGGPFFSTALALICGGMVWELARMVAPYAKTRALQMGAAATACFLLALVLPRGFGLPLLLLPSMLGISMIPQRRTMFLTFTAMILLAGYGMARLRMDQEVMWLGWLVAVVVLTDIAGYFAGRAFGGPKFWPRVSPKKTWSGTIAGWVAAAVVGGIFGVWSGFGPGLAGISVALSMASQMGDIAESAAKRKVGIKDSSNLIPGHGGLLDRFDGMLGASLMLLLTGPWTGLFATTTMGMN
ncbi:phosphatidate cytidylyltransferase [Pseudooceanicola sp. HF7]|uniref:phosphatidate cytidylyltransferase n=1 Tax=Pseudooceanicola sp. HF7 TaxID=2721560 RepID=UPI00143226EB|nr:phosphatidate cytidylyltransferase [Pseudooceanicola sp. HF7]NIZ08843.1 phosphatidate cytidylyltransferase [Pseudooceanicola sp. HF7]